MKFVPTDEIIPENWNREFFADMSAELNSKDAVAIVVIGSQPPQKGDKFFLSSPPGISAEMVKIALGAAMKEVEKVIAEQNKFKKDIN